MLLNNTTSINKLLGRFNKTADLELVPPDILHPDGNMGADIAKLREAEEALNAPRRGNMGADIAKLREAEEALNAPRRGNMGADIAKLRQAEYAESIKPGGSNFAEYQKALTQAAKDQAFGGFKRALKSGWDDFVNAGKTVKDGVGELFSGNWKLDEKALADELARRSEEIQSMPPEEREKVLGDIAQKHSFLGPSTGHLKIDPSIAAYEGFYDDGAQVEPIKPSKTETGLIPHDKGNSYTGRDIAGIAPKPEGIRPQGNAPTVGLPKALGAEERSASELLKALGIGGGSAAGAYGLHRILKSRKARKAAEEAHLQRLLRSIR